MISRRLSPLALGFVLVSCSAAQLRVMEPSEPQELARYALIIQELPDGRVEHVWKPLRDRKHAECRKRCWPPYEDCNKQNDEDSAKTVEFPTTEKAIDWLKRHRSEVQVGAVVVIAGVAFVALTGGTGALLLGPVLLLASSETSHPSAAASR